jgi:hypothetical protein
MNQDFAEGDLSPFERLDRDIATAEKCVSLTRKQLSQPRLGRILGSEFVKASLPAGATAAAAALVAGVATAPATVFALVVGAVAAAAVNVPGHFSGDTAANWLDVADNMLTLATEEARYIKKEPYDPTRVAWFRRDYLGPVYHSIDHAKRRGFRDSACEQHGSL